MNRQDAKNAKTEMKQKRQKIGFGKKQAWRPLRLGG
jgi:hypothetical protein